MELTHFNLDACNALLRLRRDRKISWRAFGLGTVIASFVNKDDGEAWPSRTKLESISGIESRDIPRVTCELRDAGFMTIEEREGRSNIYRLTYGEIAACGDLAAVGKQPPTYGEIAAKPVGKQPPITMKNNEVTMNDPHNDEKQPSPEAGIPPATDPESPEAEPSPPAPEPKAKVAKIAPKKPKATITDTGFFIPDPIRQTWATAYPGVDIDREAARAFAWCQNNPRKAPRKDYGRFLNSWMGRSEPAGKPTVPHDDDSIGYLLHKLAHVESKYGEDMARRYDAKARELNSTIKADKWLKREIECRTA